MLTEINRLILYTSSLVGSYLFIVLFLIVGSDITGLVPENFIFTLSLSLMLALCYVYYKIGWNGGVGIVTTGWLFILIFSIFFIQIPLLTPGGLALSGLPYTNIRTVDESGFIQIDEIVSSSSPEVERVRRESITHPEDRTDPYIERYFLSWRYGILLKKSQSVGNNYTTYNLYPSDFVDNVIYSIRTISETVFRFFVFTYLPFVLFLYYVEYKSEEKDLSDEYIMILENESHLLLTIYTITMGLVLVGGLSILLSSP